MRRFWVFVLAALGAAMVELVPAKAEEAPPSGVFHTGATAGIIRDATKAGGTIYAVGTWANSGAGGRIDGALWTFDGTSPVVRTALPDISSNGQNLAAGDAISPDAAFIASQVRVTGNPPTAARIARDPSTNALTNLDLMPAAAYPLSTYANRQARTISNDGSVLYGQVQKWLGLFNPNTTKIFQGRAMRFDVTGSVVTPTEIYPQAATNAGGFVTQQSIFPRAASTDGAVVIGSTFSSAPVVDTRVFRYVHGSGVTNISLLPGGTWNSPVALTDDGKIVVAFGPSTAFPNREVYLADFSTGSEVITPLGSPNEPWAFGAGGITGDGSVVAITSSTNCNPNICRYGYFHNSNGWFQLPAAMRAAGMDLTDWDHFQIQGISTDGTLVWGSGFHNGAEEGYVAEFPADFLKDFDVVPAAPDDSSIVGVWAPAVAGNSTTGNPPDVMAFMRDGTYYQIDPNGFERGSYEFNGSSLKATTRQDTNGDGGLSSLNGMLAPIGVVGDELRSPANCVFDPDNPDDCFVAHRITGSAGEVVGGWSIGDAGTSDSSAVIVLTSSGKYFMAQDGDSVADPFGRDGIEIGSYQWNSSNGVVTITAPPAVDTNGEWGLSHPIGTVTAALSVDELAMTAGDSAGLDTFNRIVDPETVVPVITSVLTADGTATTPFTYTITANRGLTFGASGAAWLSVDGSTGVVSGTPPAAGTFEVTISATNTFGDTGDAMLEISVAPPNTSSGTGVEVQPEVPPGGNAVDLTFSNVSAAGETTVTVIDANVAPPPPTGFQVGSLYYDLSTTATFSGPVEVCFSYAGVSFIGGTPRLFHFEGGWVDITTSVDPGTSTICGSTQSFSPFVILVSPVTRTGFYAPVSPVAGFVNVVKGGSTVPLKFNVSVNGVQKTDTAGLSFAVWSIGCSASTEEDPVDFTTTGSTSLRYDQAAGVFIQNWKTPEARGCYVVRVTTAQDGLSIGAVFRVK